MCAPTERALFTLYPSGKGRDGHLPRRQIAPVNWHIEEDRKGKRGQHADAGASVALTSRKSSSPALPGLHTRVDNSQLVELFLADSLAPGRCISPQKPLREADVVGCVLVRTEIALVATIQTTFPRPYDLARYMSSVSRMGASRIGASLVTSWSTRRTSPLSPLPRRRAICTDPELR